MTSGVFETRSAGVEQTMAIGSAVAPLLEAGDVILLCGGLGAGKTRFAKGVAEGMGVSDEVASPTFNILRVHETPTTVPLAHWDLYRLDDPGQLDDVDYFGVLESGCISLVEWGDKFAEAIPDECVRLDMSIGEGDARTLRFEGIGARGAALVESIAKVLREGLRGGSDGEGPDEIGEEDAR